VQLTGLDGVKGWLTDRLSPTEFECLVQPILESFPEPRVSSRLHRWMLDAMLGLILHV